MGIGIDCGGVWGWGGERGSHDYAAYTVDVLGIPGAFLLVPLSSVVGRSALTKLRREETVRGLTCRTVG